jgi:hypothetical protein
MEETIERVLQKFFKGKVPSQCEFACLLNVYLFQPWFCFIWPLLAPLSSSLAPLRSRFQVPKLKEIAREGIALALSRKETKGKNHETGAGAGSFKYLLRRTLTHSEGAST